jgi:uncharacterized membrane protein
MQFQQTFSVQRLWYLMKLLVCALILKVTLSIVANYRHYVPPDFDSEFLSGRDGYFYGSYQWAFYAHLVSGPISLLLGMVLLNDRFRNRLPAWHRVLGRIQTLNVLLLIVPSGLWMSARSDGGPVAATGFAVLAILTGICCAQGWRLAVRRRFSDHRRWMNRCFVLLCSAIVLRIIGGFGWLMNLDPEWTYPTAAWVCWLVPLAVCECFGVRTRAVA